MKYIKYVIAVLLVCLAVFVVYFMTNKDKDTDAVKFKEEYESLNGVMANDDNAYPSLSINKKNQVIYASYDKLFEILDKGTGVIYLGFPECPWCRNAVPVLLDAVSDHSSLNIYYMNMLNERDTKELDANGNIVTTKKASDNYYKLLKKLDEYLDEYTTEDKNGNKVSLQEKRVYVPLVLFVKDGVIKSVHSDTVESQTNPFVTLTKKQKEELREIYSNALNTIDSNTCSTETSC